MKSWAELHAAGMTSREAAEAMGRSETSARDWARKSGCRWHDLRGTPVTHNGVTYPTVLAAAAAIGWAPKTIFTHLARFGHLNNIGKLPKTPPKGVRAKPLSVGGRTFPSRIAAARYLGITESTLHRSLKGNGHALVSRMMARDAGWEYYAGRKGPFPGEGGRPRSPASIKAERLLASGLDRAAVCDATGMSRAQVARIHRGIADERAAA